MKSQQEYLKDINTYKNYLENCKRKQKEISDYTIKPHTFKELLGYQISVEITNDGAETYFED